MGPEDRPLAPASLEGWPPEAPADGDLWRGEESPDEGYERAVEALADEGP